MSQYIRIHTLTTCCKLYIHVSVNYDVPIAANNVVNNVVLPTVKNIVLAALFEQYVSRVVNCD